MNKGDTTTVLSLNVKREHKDKFTKICEYHNKQEEFFYVPKYLVLQRLIDQEYERLFSVENENIGNK